MSFSAGTGLSSGRRNVLFVLAITATMLNLVDRQIIAVLKPVIEVDVGWTDQDYGTLASLSEGGIHEADITDRASVETDRALELRTRDRARKLISKIDQALVRIEVGTYGYCEETDEPIGIKRLQARPIATMSIEAQERHERMERVHRDD